MERWREIIFQGAISPGIVPRWALKRNKDRGHSVYSGGDIHLRPIWTALFVINIQIRDTDSNLIKHYVEPCVVEGAPVDCDLAREALNK